VSKDTSQARVEALRQRISAGRQRADTLLISHNESPANEYANSHAFSRINSIQNDGINALATENRAKINAIIESLYNRKVAAHALPPEPNISNTGELFPSPSGLPDKLTTFAKKSALT